MTCGWNSCSTSLAPDGDLVRRTSEIVFGQRLGHKSAVASAPVCSSSRLVTAFPSLISVANAHAIDCSRWATILELPELSNYQGQRVPSRAIVQMRDVLLARADTRKEVYRTRMEELDGGDTPNLWVEALGAPGPLHVAVRATCGAAGLPDSRVAAVRLALAQALSVPIWTALSVIAPIPRLLAAPLRAVSVPPHHPQKAFPPALA